MRRSKQGNYYIGSNRGVITTTIHYDEPNECPICHYAVVPKVISEYPYPTDQLGHLAITYVCPKCNGPFVQSLMLGIDAIGRQVYIAPIIPEQRSFDPKIESLSANFVEVYNQALAAEEYKLHHIAGVGYRKALEFLIKDYAIHLEENKQDEIAKMNLAKCIQNLPEDAKRLKVVASRCVWLGNDQTHYVQLYDDKDICDMKELLDATLYWMQYSLMSDDLEASMPPRGH